MSRISWKFNTHYKTTANLVSNRRCLPGSFISAGWTALTSYVVRHSWSCPSSLALQRLISWSADRVLGDSPLASEFFPGSTSPTNWVHRIPETQPWNISMQGHVMATTTPHFLRWWRTWVGWTFSWCSRWMQSSQTWLVTQPWMFNFGFPLAQKHVQLHQIINKLSVVGEEEHIPAESISHLAFWRSNFD